MKYLKNLGKCRVEAFSVKVLFNGLSSAERERGEAREINSSKLQGLGKEHLIKFITLN